LTGQWTKDNAGGCHLYDSEFESFKKDANFSWKDNPKYNIRLHSSTKKPSVKITLSRPEKAWKKQVAESSVDCMMGMYIWSLEDSRNPNLKFIMS